MESRSSNLSKLGFALLLPLTLLGLIWANDQIVRGQLLSAFNPGDEHFVRYWVGTRALLLKGENIYGDDVTLQVQKLVYGRPAQPTEYSFPITYPLFSCAFFLPFATIGDYFLARAVWLTFLDVILALLALLWLRLTGWKLPGWMILAYLLFTLGCYHTLIPWLNGSAIILSAFFLALALLTMRSGRYEVAGVLLALVMIQPAALTLAVVFILLWSASQGRRTLVFSFWGTLILMIVVGVFIRPDWPLQYLRVLVRFVEFTGGTSVPPPSTLGAVLTGWWPGVGRQLGWGVTGILTVILIVEWWQARRWQFNGFLWALSLTLVVGQWVGLPTSPTNYLLLLLPLTVVLATWENHAHKSGHVIAAQLSCVAIWLILGVGIWLIALGDQRNPVIWPAQPPALFIPLPLLLLIGLFWVRWWAIRPHRLLRNFGTGVEELPAHEEL